jgi:hypothetical protein
MTNTFAWTKVGDTLTAHIDGVTLRAWPAPYPGAWCWQAGHKSGFVEAQGRMVGGTEFMPPDGLLVLVQAIAATLKMASGNKSAKGADADEPA